jgi:hypothetical protein
MKQRSSTVLVLTTATRTSNKWIIVDASYSGQMNGAFVTVDLRNYCYFEASFDLIATFTNATFARNNTAGKLRCSHDGQESRDTDVCFIIDDNASGFVIVIWFQFRQGFHSEQ